VLPAISTTGGVVSGSRMCLEMASKSEAATFLDKVTSCLPFSRRSNPATSFQERVTQQKPLAASQETLRFNKQVPVSFWASMIVVQSKVIQELRKVIHSCHFYHHLEW
jgi:hypothetical protein